MIPTEKAYMQFAPKVSRIIAEIEKVRRWLESQQGIKRYCQQNPEAYRMALELLGDAQNSLRRSFEIFLRGKPAVVR